jgi:hypothetical protein
MAELFSYEPLQEPGQRMEWACSSARNYVIAKRRLALGGRMEAHTSNSPESDGSAIMGAISNRPIYRL